MISYDLGRSFCVTVDKIYRFFISIHKIIYFICMILNKLIVCDHNSCHKFTSVIHGIFPQFVQIQGNLQLIVFHQRCSYKRLRKKSDCCLILHKCGNYLCVLRFKFNSHIFFRVDSIRFKNRVQGIFRSCTLPTGINSLSLKILHRFYTVSILHKIENTQRIDRQNTDILICLLIQRCCQICRNSCNIKLVLYYHRNNLIRRCSNRKIVSVFIKKLRHSHCCRTFQGAYPDSIRR